MKVPINKSKKKSIRREIKLLGGASVSMLTIVIVLMFTASSAVPRYTMRNKQVAAVVSANPTQNVIAQNAAYKASEDAAPAIARDSAVYRPEKPPLWAYMIGVPHTTLRYMYYLLGIFVIFALAYTTRFELRKHHIRHATGAGFLIGLMGILLLVAQFMIFAEPVLVTGH